MADFRAIGGVSATLQTLLLDRMERPDDVTTVPVTVGPPAFGAREADPHKEDPRVHLFLYRVTENGYLQNQQIAGRGSSSGYGHPPLSLNLHYLLTAYGNVEVLANGRPMFDDTTAQFLLGSAMRVLHDVPVITEAVTTISAPSGATILHASLRDEVEQVKLALEPLTLEDITKVWTALALRYRLGAPYVVNVVQIESRRPPSLPRLVGQPASGVTPPLPSDPPHPGPRIHVITIQTPTIADLKVRRGDPTEQPFPYARIGDTLVLRGTSMSGPRIQARFGELEVPTSHVAADRVEVVLPDATITGVGPIPPERQLQPGVRTVKLAVSDPALPQSSMASNEAAFMLVPGINPALAFAPGPPRTLTIDGTRLVGPSAGGETVIGRSVVERRRYLSATPTQLVVPIPDALPERGVRVSVSGTLGPSVPIGPGAQRLIITIGAGPPVTVTANLPTPVSLGSLPGILASLIHDGAPTDTRFAGTRVDLMGTRLVVVPGGLTAPIAITSPGGLTFAADLQLTGVQPPGAGSALISGALSSVPELSSPNPRLRIQIGVAPPQTVAVPKASSLSALATALQSALNALPGAEYANALVTVSGSQLLIIPGAAGNVECSAAPGDDTTVVELQLHARFAVRVRVNGAESIDEALVELPQ